MSIFMPSDRAAVRLHFWANGEPHQVWGVLIRLQPECGYAVMTGYVSITFATTAVDFVTSEDEIFLKEPRPIVLEH